MNCLVVFYSRTGITGKVAQAIAGSLKCDMEEIYDLKDRKGFFGYLKSGRDAMKKNLTIIKDFKKDPFQYDLVIIGTPVWAGKMACAVRTYVQGNKDRLNNVAFFCTMGRTGSEGCFKDMGMEIGKKPGALLPLRTKEVVNGGYIQKMTEFVSKFNSIGL